MIKGPSDIVVVKGISRVGREVAGRKGFEPLAIRLRAERST